MLLEQPRLHPHNPHTPPMSLIKGMMGHEIVPLLLTRYSLSDCCARELGRVHYSTLGIMESSGTFTAGDLPELELKPSIVIG